MRRVRRYRRLCRVERIEPTVRAPPRLERVPASQRCPHQVFVRRCNMPANPNPNVRLIQVLAGVQTVARAYSVLQSAGLSELAEEALEFIFEDFPDAVERAYLLDFMIRHGGLTVANVRRVLPGWAHQRTNKCGKCRFPGHNQAHCPGILI